MTEHKPNGLPTIEMVVRPGQEFDTGMSDGSISPTVSGAVRLIMGDIQKKMTRLGFDIARIEGESLSSSKSGKNDLLKQIHDASAILYMQWWGSHKNRDQEVHLAAARLFNRMTLSARRIAQWENGKVYRESMAELKGAIREDVKDGLYAMKNGLSSDHSKLVQTIASVSENMTHEIMWPWVALPTFTRQHYGRVVLGTVDLEQISSKAFIVQPTFNDNEATLFHTHGQNWAFSTPFGREEGSNRHSNLMMQPNSDKKLFPLKLLRSDYYSSKDVVTIAPKSIHAIVGKRKEGMGISLDDFASLSSGKQAELISLARFGERSCLHIYLPDVALAREFNSKPVNIQGTGSPQDFFETYDMILLNNREQRAEVGGGGAWERRCLETFGKSGEHCGVCFVERAARIVVPDSLVMERFIEKKAEPVIIHRSVKFKNKA